MNRVLLLLDDYSEMMFIQIILKKLGFDTDALQNHHTLPDKLLSFRPNLLILNEDGRKSSTESTLSSARAQVPDLRFVLLRPKTSGVEVLGQDIRRINTPIHPIELILATGQSCNIPTEGLVEKFKKFKGQLNLPKDQQRILDMIDLPPSEEPDKGVDRMAEYRKYLSQNKEPVKSTFSGSEVQAKMKVSRAAGKSDSGVDRARKSFAKELFKKAKKQ